MAITKKFVCRLGTPAGELITRTVEAVGASEARVRLEGEGFRVFSVLAPNQGGAAALPSLIRRGGGENNNGQARIKTGDFLLFNQQLAALLRAGIPILQSITMLGRRAPNAKLRVLLTDIEERIRGGAALSQAFAAQGDAFPRIYTASMLAGERSGALDEVLRRYVEYVRRGVEMRRKVRGALAYPMLLLAASFAMVIFLTLFVVPRMSTLFAGFGRELPTITVIVVSGSTFVATNLYWIVPLLLIAGGGFYYWSRTPDGQIKIDQTLLKLPIAGKLLQQLAVTQATRSMATMLAGGITLVESWEIAAESITNRALRARSSAVLPMIREGRTFTDAVESAGWLPELARDMIGVGERSGSLREMLEEVASFYDAEAEVRLEQLTTVLEPVILLVMGGIVVTILLSIYLPIIQTISTASTR
ncbi:MAG: type II secretion system F family protein [Pyrinomonadaceae bacterium MAG19_C2-C3]|nr:type II secretion system F family protein [Pyrinomonadaceae bacterium MAG19_C2-C3]